MSTNRILAISAAASALALAAPSNVLAQDATTPADAGASYSAEIPAEYATHSYASEAEVERTVAEDGTVVETVTRTRRIPARAAAHHAYYAEHAAYQTPYYHGVVWDRETWLAECHARTRNVERKKRGGIIGGLLGAITGGIIGNRAWDSERLAGTVIGAGAGGLVGGLIGSAIDRDGDDRPYYDCEEALDRYMSGAAMAPRFAARSIPAYGHGYGYAPMVAYAPMYATSYAYAQPMTYIETTEEFPQQVVVREYVTEEWVEEPAPPRPPATRYIKEVPQAPTKLVPVKPRPVKSTPIKGN